MRITNNPNIPMFDNQTQEPIKSTEVLTQLSNIEPSIKSSYTLQPSDNLQLDQLRKPNSLATTAPNKIFADLSTKPNSLSRRISNPKEAISFIKDFNETLGLSPADLKEKYSRMAESSFVLFRAMPALFYKDIQSKYLSSSKLLNRPAPNIVINGDMHIENFGTFRGPDGKAVWGINDYDQSALGSPEWDLERLATSAVFVARQAGLGKEAEKQLIETITNKYFDTVKDIADGRENARPYIEADQVSNPLQDLIEKASNEKRKIFLEKYARQDSNGKYKFLDDDKLQKISKSQAKEIKTALNDYETELGNNIGIAKPLQILDIAKKLGSGGSSYGLARYYVLVANDDKNKAPIILEIKALLPSPINSPSQTDGANAREVIENQSILSSHTNPLTGAIELNKRSFLVRELEPEKNSYSSNKITNLSDAQELFQQAAKVLGRAHSRVEGQALAIRDWVGNDEKKVIKRLTDFASKYADHIETVSQELASQLEVS